VFPVTEYLQIILFEGVLQLTATDTSNFIHYTEKGIEGTDGQVIVLADTLIKLVSKTKKDKMKFEFDGAVLVAKGNGSHKIPVFESEEFPAYEFDLSIEPTELSTIIFKDMLSINEAAIATDMVVPCLTGYNIGDNTITMDGIKMCINNTLIFEGTEERMLITQELADLIHTLTSDKVKVQKQGNKILFTTDNITIFGTELDGIEDYPDIAALAELEYDNQVIIGKSAILDILDRLSIFVDKHDNNGIRMTLGTEKMTIEDIKRNSKEDLGYIEHQIQEETVLCVNIDFFKDLLSTLSEPNVTMKFGGELPITIVEKKVTQVLSTMDDEEIVQ
jgi:DNA polymerase III sliding clamp (beta) subunit (PCNA family)